MVIPEKLREFLNENRQGRPPITDPNEPLHLDSLAIIRLVSFLEVELGYTIQDEELIMQNFESVNRLMRMLEGKGVKDSLLPGRI
jgi:acyl carrier protein